MNSTSEAPVAIEFGRFRVLPHRRELLADGRAVELGGRAFDVLMALIEASGEVVGKEALMDRVWRSRIVEENSLQAQIAALRKALGADRDLIRTISGRGYQFTAVIRTVATASEVVQVAAAAVPTSASPRAPTNLPEWISELIGRQAELNEMLGLAAAHRLVTLVGAGGIGKTRLGIEVARHLLPEFAEGVWLAELAPLSDPTLVPVTVATALSIDVAGGAMSAQRVASALASRHVALLLDNCEHMVDAAASMAEALLRTNPSARILATSREPLRVEGEWIYPVPPLAVPAEDASGSADPLGYGAVRLFIERARAADPRFSPNPQAASTIAAICRRLDGIPLAIELAATRVTALGVEQLAARLDDRFSLLAGGRRTTLPRQQTLRATLDWSYELLSEPERAVLRHLSIFAGGFTLEAASQVATCAGVARVGVIDCVANLVDKSLVTADVSGPEARYRLLETIRAYAFEKLIESSEHAGAARRHAEYYRNLFQRAAAETKTRSAAEWLAVHAPETDNLRAALDWAFAPGGDATIGVALAIASERLWFGLSLIDECQRRVERAIASLEPGASGNARPEMQLNAILAAALFNTKGPGPEAHAAWTEVLATAERLDDTEHQLRGIWGLWYHHIGNGELQAALTLAQKHDTLPPDKVEPVDRLVGERMIATSLHYLGELSGARRRAEHVVGHCTAAIRRSHMTRFKFDLAVSARGTLAKVLWLQGFPDQAMRMATDNVADARDIDREFSVSLYWALDTECMLALSVGELAIAESSTATLLEHAVKHALSFWQAMGHGYKGQLLIRRSDIVNGVRFLRAGLDELREARYMLRFPGLLCVLAEGMAGIGQISQAQAAIDAAFAQCERTDERWTMSELLRVRGELLLREGGSEPAAEDHYRQALDWARRQGALSWELRCATSLARLWRDQGRRNEARELLASVYDRFTEGFTTADLVAARSLIEETS